jgi:hypothetical protein
VVSMLVLTAGVRLLVFLLKMPGWPCELAVNLHRKLHKLAAALPSGTILVQHVMRGKSNSPSLVCRRLLLRACFPPLLPSEQPSRGDRESRGDSLAVGEGPSRTTESTSMRALDIGRLRMLTVDIIVLEEIVETAEAEAMGDAVTFYMSVTPVL